MKDLCSIIYSIIQCDISIMQWYSNLHTLPVPGTCHTLCAVDVEQWRKSKVLQLVMCLIVYGSSANWINSSVLASLNLSTHISMCTFKNDNSFCILLQSVFFSFWFIALYSWQLQEQPISQLPPLLLCHTDDVQHDLPLQPTGNTLL